MSYTGPQLLSTISQSMKQLLARPVRYYLDDRASNTLVIYGAIKIVVVVGAMLVALTAVRFHFLAALPVFPSSLTNWDGGWYIAIARSWYAEGSPNSAAFFPLYPLLIRLLSLDQPSAMQWVSIIISNAFSFVALYFLYRLVPLVIDERYRLRVCLAFMVFPVLIVSTLVAYSEALFIALTIGSYYYWKRSKFALAALLAICSIFARQVGVFILVIFVVDMCLEYWSQHDTKRALRQLATTGATAVGVAALYLFYYVRFGNPFIVAQVEASNWGQTFSVYNVFQTLGLSLFGVDTQPLNSFLPSPVPLIAIGALIVVAAAVCLRKRNVALSIYSLLSLLLVLSLPGRQSYPRLVAAIFPIYLFFGLMLSDNWRKNLIFGTIAVAVAIQNLYIWLSGAWLY